MDIDQRKQHRQPEDDAAKPRRKHPHSGHCAAGHTRSHQRPHVGRTDDYAEPFRTHEVHDRVSTQHTGQHHCHIGRREHHARYAHVVTPQYAAVDKHQRQVQRRDHVPRADRR